MGSEDYVRRVREQEIDENEKSKQDFLDFLGSSEGSAPLYRQMIEAARQADPTLSVEKVVDRVVALSQRIQNIAGGHNRLYYGEHAMLGFLLLETLAPLAACLDLAAQPDSRSAFTPPRPQPPANERR